MRMGGKREIRVKSCDPRHPEWKISVRDKWGTSVKSCGLRHPEWETSVRETSGKKCKLMRPKAPRVGDKCGRQVWETSVNSYSPMRPE